MFPSRSFADDPRLYFWNNRTDYFDLIDFSASDPRPRGFDADEKTVVIVHGFGENIHTEMYRTFARRIKSFEPETNVLALDWLENQDIRWIPGTDPITAANTIPAVADWAYLKLFNSRNGLGIRAQKLHMIGFSHGAHVVALIGKHTGGCVAHLTFLDPSPGKSHLFSWENFLGKGWTADESGKFVDMYKTSQWAATSSCRGHVSFLVREKGTILKENSIEDIFTNHLYALHWYLSTIGKKYSEFGYSINIPDKRPPECNTWTGTISSTLPKKPSAKDDDTAADTCVKN